MCTSNQFYFLQLLIDNVQFLSVFRAEVKTILAWQNSIEEDLRTKLKEPLLVRVCHQISLDNNKLFEVKVRLGLFANTKKTLRLP